MSNPSGGKTWSDAMVAELRQLFAEGLSNTQIAARMGKPHNAVIGILHRLKLYRSESQKSVARSAGGKRGPKINNPSGMTVMRLRALKEGTAARPALPPRVTLPPAEALAAPVSIADLGHAQCRYIGERPALLTLDTPIYCGAPTDGGSWCPAHRAVCIVRRAA